MKRRPHSKREQGVALLIVLGAITILSILLADMHESTSTAYAVATSERDQLQAEYMAKSGLNLTRLLINAEPQIRQTFTPMYMAMFHRPPPQLPVWTFANDILAPFCNYDQAKDTLTSVGVDVSTAEGLGKTPATCEIQALAENSKINVNDPLNLDGERARRSIAMQLFAMMGGYQSPSPYDPLFENRDADGHFTSRLDIVSAIIDWWDQDTDRTVFDPGSGEVTSQGSEDDFYQTLPDPYRRKNAPFDSLQELRLVRGIDDDFWSTFVEPNPDDPNSRVLTIYGSGAVNPNEAPPQVLLARLCSYLDDQLLCSDPTEAAKFIQVVDTARSLVPAPFFTRASDFLDFVQGRGGANGLYPMLQAFLGKNSPLLFRPVTIPANMHAEIENSFVTAARIITIISTGVTSRARVRIHSVVNFDQRWTPPPPNAGRMPPLGVFHYYRID